MDEDSKNIIEEQDTELTQDEAKEMEEQERAMEAIRKFTEADEDEDEDSLGEISLKSIIGGDILQSRFMLHQVVFFMFLVVLAIIYTGNRYSSQQDALLIDSLKMQLQEENYRVLTIESELLNASRQSEIVNRLKNNGDSLLLHSTTPPFVIKNDDSHQQ